jgi:dipeptidyl-peptidase 9
LLYEEVDESRVELVSLLTLPGREPEKFRFPTPGSPNAASTLRLLAFNLEAETGKVTNVQSEPLPVSISSLFSWSEYLVRAGWTPDGLK